jgi:aspartyl-tRNA(Asn)/glutamyl-tRNA(Gln) amidotransferase subunit A
MERPAARAATDLLGAYADGSLSPVDVVRDVAVVVAAR